MSGTRMLRAAAVALAASAVLAGAAPAAHAAAGDIGFPDHVYSPLGGSPTGSKPESKLWFNRGWWASMFHPASGTHHIFKLDRASQTWNDTGTVVDTRSSTRADTLWDPNAANGGKLYVASHTWTTSPGTGSPGRLFRYSYSATTDKYTLDTGYPVDINAVKTETLVIDKDSTGMLWATWMVGNQIFVNHTTGSDNQWATPRVVPGSGTTVSSDDISSVVHFGGNKIGVMWSNQVDHHFWFAVHNDGAPDTAWTSSAVPFAFLSDDHINLKTDAAGRVYAAVKTSETTSTRPLISLLVRSATGTWSDATLGTVSNSNTRPIVELDEQAGIIHVFSTGPSPPNRSGQSGGTIYEKTSPISPISFAAGLGTPVIREAAFADMNDATSTKENVDASTGLVVMANNATSLRYWHFDSAAGAAAPPPPPPPAPVADFTADKTSGQPPLSVQFTDASTGSPTSWQWSFGDGATSPAQSPSHTYQAAGTYDVSLTATNANGSNTKTKVGFITVSATTPTPGGTTVTIPPSADAQVSEAGPTSNYGAVTTFRVRLIAGGSYHTYLRFVVSGLAAPPKSAKLRLTVTDASPDGGRVYVADPNWIESGAGGITWNSAPPLPAASFATIGASTAVGQVVEADLGNSITGNGTYNFGLASNSTNSAIYSSRESSAPPQLVLTTG